MKLLTPVKIGPIEVKNRIVSTAHSAFLEFYEKEGTGSRYIAYQERRAQGGTGLIIMTAWHVHPSAQMPAHPSFHPEVMPSRFREISSRLHAHGAKVFVQLLHTGVQAKSDNHDDLHPLWGFSPATTLEGEPCHVMTDAEIEVVIDSYVEAALCATRNGVDGVELHASHGYLIQQSFTPRFNFRGDKWGRRLFFASELARRVRTAIGPDKAMGFRISLDDFLAVDEGGLGPEGLRDVACELVATGLFDFVNTSAGKGGPDYARAIGSYRYKFGPYLPLAEALHARLAGAVPLIATSKIPTPDLAERALEEGWCDLVGMTRAQISDPDLVLKLQTGQASRIRTCTGANQGCIDRAVYHPITCIQNPEVGEERRFLELAKPIESSKRVLVVGGGPAGMKAAEICARRGHEVTLAEAGSRLGGRLNLVELLGAASNLLSSTAWIEQELGLLPVKLLLQTYVDETFLAAHAPDEIIMATGAIALGTLDIPTDQSIPIISVDEAAAGTFEGQKFDMAGTRALVVDVRANYETALVIEGLAKRGALVTVATPHMQFGANLGFTHVVDLLETLPELGVEVHPLTQAVEIANGEVHFRGGLGGRKSPGAFDFVVAGLPPVARDGQLDLFHRYAPTRLIGDVLAPRSALEAIREGDRAGRQMR